MQFAQTAACNRLHNIEQRLARWLLITQDRVDSPTLAITHGAFLGEQCIANSHSLRMTTATAITAGAVLKIDKKEMVRTLHEHHAMSDIFVSYLLTRNVRVQEDMVDQLFNSSEKRLARALLLLAQFGKEGAPETVASCSTIDSNGPAGPGFWLQPIAHNSENLSVEQVGESERHP